MTPNVIRVPKWKFKIFRYILFLIPFVFSCTSKILKYEKVDQLKKNAEFESIVKIDTLAEIPAASITPSSEKSDSIPKRTNESALPLPETKSKTKIKPIPRISKGSKGGDKITETPSQGKIISRKGLAKSTIVKEQLTPKKESPQTPPEDPKIFPPILHLPEIEDSNGFTGRRPNLDPFRVGETVIHEVNYLKVKAGEFEMRVGPYKSVNGRKAYSFIMGLRSANMFSKIYSVDDSAETLVDFESFIPRVFSLHVKESGQLREGQSYFDHDKLTATYWEKKYTEKNGNEEKKQEWQILPFSQNVFSAIYYLRTFKWEIGKEYVFRIADDQENILFKGKALRRERISTALGEMNAIVMKPEVSVKGIFKPMGDIFFWLSDDDRKFILRMELNIKIGSLVSEVVRIVPGI